MKRLKINVHGAVQGVGFRPFIYRLARQAGLTGWVCNTGDGVLIEAEGRLAVLRSFLLRIEQEKPPRAYIQGLEHRFVDPAGFEDFVIRASDHSGAKSTLVLPDIATCPDCLNDIFDPLNRRYLYPFTNCTNCGPRLSIIESLPYDRPHTSMKAFPMCAECLAEYQDPLDRRFHAQPNACRNCGPHLELWDSTGSVVHKHHQALIAAAAAIRAGGVVGVKGLGGFHLMTRADLPQTVALLRQRKNREEKPFALMFPDLPAVERYCLVSEMEKRLLTSAESPIVLLRKKNSVAAGLADDIAPGNPYIGAMLPYTPVHHLLLAELGFPLIATSGNLSDEPICIDENEALQRLGDIADCFLMHNRPIVRQVDDSIITLISGREMMLRRARGYAPLPVGLPSAGDPTLATGAHLKNNIAFSIEDQAFISQHIGDLENEPAYRAFRNIIADFERLYHSKPTRIACDKHPDYLSTQYALTRGLPLLQIQHHYAHILSCMVENELSGPVLGICWDGTGYGDDGEIWGGEFLLVDSQGFERVGHFRSFSLPGGEIAIREPRRSALGMLYELRGKQLFAGEDQPLLSNFSDRERRILAAMLARGINSPRTTSVGRVFDAVASLLDLCQSNRYEGQAAMALEFLINEQTPGHYQCQLRQKTGGGFVLDWAPMLEGVLGDLKTAVQASVISAKFHQSLIESAVIAARAAGQEKVVLSGGCFQNRFLAEGLINRLQLEGFKPYWHQRVPPNDGGIALGQIFAALRVPEQTKSHKTKGKSHVFGDSR